MITLVLSEREVKILLSALLVAHIGTASESGKNGMLDSLVDTIKSQIKIQLQENN